MPIWKTLENRLKTPKIVKNGEYMHKLPLSPYKQMALKYTGGSIFRALNAFKPLFPTRIACPDK
jgi:hypothetical protein